MNIFEIGMHYYQSCTGPIINQSRSNEAMPCCVKPWFYVQLLHATRCNNCRLSNVLENIHEAKMLQPMTAFGEIT